MTTPIRRPAAAWRSLLLLGCAAAVTPGCGGSSPDADHAGGHVHTAPRGGDLVVLAEETAHAEFLFDGERGSLDVYLLGAHAERPLRSAQAAIELIVDEVDGAAESQEYSLAPVASELSGETAGDSSHFALLVPELVGKERLRGRLREVELQGSRYTDLDFAWPPAADEDHDHAHDDDHDHDHEH